MTLPDWIGDALLAGASLLLVCACALEVMRLKRLRRKRRDEELSAVRPLECVGKDPRGCWNVRCQLGESCCRIFRREETTL